MTVYTPASPALWGQSPTQRWAAEVSAAGEWATRILVALALLLVRLAWLLLRRLYWGSGETVFCTVLAAVWVAALIRFHPVRWPTATQALTNLYQVVGTIVGVYLVLVWVRVAQMAGSHGHAHGHVHHVAGEGGLAALERHEKAHQDVTRRLGGGGSTIRIWRDSGGWSGTTTYHDWRRVAALPPAKQVAICLAGVMAAPSTTSPTDMPHAKAISKTTHRPGETMRQGRKIARRTL